MTGTGLTAERKEDALDGSRQGTMSLNPKSRAYCGTHVGTKKPSTVLNRDCSTADIFVPVYFVLHNPSGDSRSKLGV